MDKEIENTAEQVIEQMQHLLRVSSVVETEENKEALVYADSYDWLATLPSKKGDLFIEVEWDDKQAVFCVSELDWPVAQQIETESFRKNEAGETYLSGEYERRETLRRAIRWAAEPVIQRVSHNTDGSILSRLTHGVVEALWERYTAHVSIDADEASALYQSAHGYFAGRNQEGLPTPPLIIEVDYMVKGLVSMSRKKFAKMKTSEFERIQLILMARADAMGLNGRMQRPSEIAANEDAIESLPSWMFPPGMR